MVSDEIKYFLLNACNKDKDNYRNLINGDKTYNNQWSYIVEMMIVTIKSLMPSTEKVSVEIDYNRLNKEMDLWINYRHGTNVSLKNIMFRRDSKIYWSQQDISIYGRIFIITYVNKNYGAVEREVIKNILYTTGNISQMMEGILLSRFLFIIFKGEIDVNKIIDELKQYTIYLSKEDMVKKYKKYFRFETDTYDGNYTLDFERNKINALNIFHGMKDRLGLDILRRCIDIMTNNLCVENEKNYFVYGFYGFVKREFIQNIDIKDYDFIESLCDYLIKLKKGRIDPNALSINSYEIPDVFEFKEKQRFKHSLLGECKVIKRNDEGEFILSFIKNKTGTYRFLKKTP